MTIPTQQQKRDLNQQASDLADRFGSQINDAVNCIELVNDDPDEMVALYNYLANAVAKRLEVK